MTVVEKVIDLIFPPSCGICEKIDGNYICKECYNKIKPYLLENKDKTKIHLLKYEGIIRDKIIDYKFNDKSYLYKMFFEILIKNKKACEFISHYDIIISVPIHKKRKRQRGYNQTELIAKAISRYFKIEFDNNILKKVIHTVPQSTLDKKARENNIKNAFRIINEQKIIGKRVLILDDIYTTGATLNECKSVLNKAKQIGIITIAKD